MAIALIFFPILMAGLAAPSPSNRCARGCCR
jgi:hypothetical protein